MMHLPFTRGALLAAAMLSAPAFGQGWTETFDNGSNAAGWEIWFVNHNSLPTTGGNPDGYLRLNNSAGPLTCQFVEVKPMQALAPFAFGGDWRARGVSAVGTDVLLVAGPAPSPNAQWVLTLSSDPGTPADPNDDCRLVYRDSVTPLPVAGAPWTSIDWPVDAASTTLPNGWVVEGPCSTTMTPDQAWNAAIVDIDRFVIRVDMDAGTFCAFSAWDIGIDNLRLFEGSGIGVPYCTPAVANSTGSPARIAAFGTGGAGAVLDLRAEDLPANQFGFFLTSRNQTFVPGPGGSQGNLCLASPIGRFNSQALNSGASGAIQDPIDTGAMPMNPSVSVLAGETWHFQAWYRDLNPAPTSNFTDAISVQFN